MNTKISTSSSLFKCNWVSYLTSVSWSTLSIILCTFSILNHFLKIIFVSNEKQFYIIDWIPNSKLSVCLHINPHNYKWLQQLVNLYLTWATAKKHSGIFLLWILEIWQISKASLVYIFTIFINKQPGYILKWNANLMPFSVTYFTTYIPALKRY